MWQRFLAVMTIAMAGLACADDPPAPKAGPKAAAPQAKDLAAPVAILADGKPINVDIGHAAPFVADFAGDGTLHLLVGQFEEGKLRIYRNEGPKNQPRFGNFTWFLEGEGKVPAG